MTMFCGECLKRRRKLLICVPEVRMSSVYGVGLAVMCVLNLLLIVLLLTSLECPSKNVQSDHQMEIGGNNPAQRNVTVLCMILTMPQNWDSKARSVRETWARKCHIQVFFYSKFPNHTSHEIYQHPNTVALDVGEGRHLLTSKTFAAFEYSHKKYGNIADWYLKADDDVYVVWENLMKLLRGYDPRRPFYLGFKFGFNLRKGFNSGGAGYLVSGQVVPALLRGYPRCARDIVFEDVAVGQCLEDLEVYPEDTLDRFGKARFGSFNPFRNHIALHCLNVSNLKCLEFGDGYRRIEMKKIELQMSEDTITFHKVSPGEMFLIEFTLYRLAKNVLTF